jgi:hypothetical protein
MKILAFMIFVLMLCGCSSRPGIIANMSSDAGINWDDGDVIPICIWSWTF